MAQYALLANEPLVEAVTYSLIDNGSIMARDIPFANKQTLIANGVRFEGNLPTVNWSQLNAEGVVSIGSPKPYQEVAYTIRNYVDVDKRFVQDENQIADPRSTQVEAVLKAIAYDFNDKFFNNDHVSGNANAPVGLKYRIANGSTYGVRSENSIDAGGTDLTSANITATTANAFLEQLDQLLWSVDAPNGSPSVCIYMNDVMLRRFRRALRVLGTSGGLDVTRDQFDRVIESYKGCPVLDVGYKADQSTKIIPGNGKSGSSAVGETSAGVASTGSSALYTSVYAVNYAPGHFMGWQFEPLQAEDIGLLNNGVIYRTLIDWAGGLMNASTRSIARLYDVKTGG